jgi:hypothetical protein
MNSEALEVPSSILLAAYQRKWTMRPRSLITLQHLDELQTKMSLGRRWASRFRKRWGLTLGTLREVRSLSREDLRQRAAIYIRWLRWAVSEQPPGASTIVVAMDETSVTNVKRTAKGTVVPRSRQGDLRQNQGKPRRNLRRTTLIACVCSDASLQPHMPQIWLPLTDPTRLPPASMRAVFTASGAPHEAWHGTKGFVTQRLLRAWLTRMHRRVRILRPKARIVVVMDVCPAHVAQPLLAAAARLGLILVFVPARLTWLLQILDTHVFAQLKREMRRRFWMATQRSADHCLSPAEQLQALTEAATDVLVRRSWSHLFPRVGLDGSIDNLRPSLQTLLVDADLAPRLPTESELAVLLGGHRQHLGAVHRLLCGPSPDAHVGAVIPGASASSAPAEVDGDPDQVLGPLLAPEQQSTADPTTTSSAAPAAGQAVRLPRGRPLWPCPHNLRVLPEPPAPPGERVATRSQKRPLVSGVVGAPKRSRSLLIP